MPADSLSLFLEKIVKEATILDELKECVEDRRVFVELALVLGEKLGGTQVFKEKYMCKDLLEPYIYNYLDTMYVYSLTKILKR